MSLSGDVDRISALPDDLLHLILTFVCEAKAVTRTAALSRRWRRVWIHAQHLALSDTRLLRSAESDQFVGFVDWVLAQRGDADIGSLDVLTSVAQGPSPEQVNGWLFYAAGRVVKSLCLHLPYYGYSSSAAAAVIVLPDQGRMTSLTLLMSRWSWRLQLPAAADARYEALTDLSLSCMTFSGAGRTLGDFVSSCCPRLRKLGISGSKGLTQLAFRSEALQKLKLCHVEGLRVLDVTAPNLRVLKLDYAVGEVLRIAAPRLQEIGIDPSSISRRSDLDIHDLTGVRRLRHLRLNMHGQYCALVATDIGFWLLENCPSADYVSLWLEHSRVSVTEGIEVVDLTSEGASPFANVLTMYMTVGADQFPEGHLVPSVFALLLRCPRLRSLDIRIIAGPDRSSRSRLSCFCDELLPWTDHREISLRSLEDVRISRFTEADEDVDLFSLICSVLQHSSATHGRQQALCQQLYQANSALANNFVLTRSHLDGRRCVPHRHAINAHAKRLRHGLFRIQFRRFLKPPAQLQALQLSVNQAAEFVNARGLLLADHLQDIPISVREIAVNGIHDGGGYGSGYSADPTRPQRSGPGSRPC
ncbi:hypothetical protein C2845_PM05G17720 [Panicum miliaceum]|uniref:F-box domain-containing protein n=1 Tax=Panicum miliaceum TaxID=4540 RepID=A0A3L6T243_PANMI|nr:hypothetical protein C2845_PM05G17720 [Panicum miliaceum]